MQSTIAYLDTLQASGIRPGLGRMRALLRQLGRPEKRVPAIIVAGTNGKGSTSATLASILTSSGYRTGFYTSPHLVDLRERWMIDGTPIPEELLIECVDRMRSAAEEIGITPTYFEALTVLAFIAFDRTRCDVAVIEVGMGGRLDATNVIRPLASLITPIGFDHTEFLGNTLKKIAAEKAGVIHRDAVVLTSNRDPVVLSVLRKRAAKFGNRYHEVLAECRIEPPFQLTTPTDQYRLATPLKGDFQRDNVVLAVRAAEELRGRLPMISAGSITRGVAATRWPGRLDERLIDGRHVWIDGFHNAHAAAVISEFIREEIPSPRLLVFGIMADKGVEDVVRTIFPLFDAIVTTEPYPPRSRSASALGEMAADLGIPALIESDPTSAIRLAISMDYRNIVIGGSLYLAGTAVALIP